MKKVFHYLLFLSLVFTVSFSLSSCGDFGDFGNGENETENNESQDGENDESQDGGNNQGGENDNPADPEKVYKDKEDFQRIAIELMDEFDTSDFEHIMELAEYICREYAEYETGEAEEWLDDCLEELYTELESDKSYPVYETIYKASAFKGKFVAENGRWKRYDSDNLSLHVKDQNGNPCEIVLTTSGRTKKVHCWDEESWYYEYWWDEYGNYHWNEGIGSEERIWIEVPENITVVLKQNGNKLAEAVLNADLSSMQGSDFNLSKDKYNINARVYFNGYSFNIDNISYENKKESTVAFSFKHGNKNLLTANLSITPQIDEPVAGFDEDDFLKTFDSKNNNISINILDQMELKGSCNSFRDLLNVIDEEWDEHTDSKINRYLDINIYFYGAKEPAARIEFESFEDDKYYYTDYDLEPIIIFNDKSRNSLEDFFNEDDFRRAIDAFNDLLNGFEDLIYGYDFDF